MIVFFSGTGNSRHIAKLAAEYLKDDILDISVYTRKHEGVTLSSSKPYVLVAPAYASYIPRVVEYFIKRSEFEGNRDFYLIITCGASVSSGGISMKIKPLLKEKGLTYKGVKQIVMPENFITMFFAPSEDNAKKIIANAEEKLPSVLDTIKDGKDFYKRSFPSFFNYVVNPLFYKIYVTDRHYYTTDECISCGKCVKVCPLANIELVDGKPRWKGDCTQCMACIGSCPKKAIEYGNKTAKKRRYYLD